MQHLTSCLTKCEDTLYRNLKDHLPAIALANHNTAFNSAMKCTPLEAMYGLRAKTITEAGASPRLHITAEGAQGSQGSKSLTIINGINHFQNNSTNLQSS
jgi:hypothetical protein